MNEDIQPLLKKLSQTYADTAASFLQNETSYLAIECAFNMIVITDTKGKILYANPAVERITGYSREETIGKNPQLWGGQMPDEFYQNMWATIQGGRVFVGEITNKRKNGDIYDAKISISPITKDRAIIGFIGTEEDITLQKRLQQDKDEFISMVSHQLRTPLGSIKWSLELMREKPSGLDAELAELARTNQNMIDMVNMLLTVMRIKDNRFSLKEEKIDLRALVDEILREFTERITLNRLRIKAAISDAATYVVSDRTLLHEIITNLLDNAVKYSLPDKDITLTYVGDHDHWSLTIKDEGIGIPEEDLAKITNKYFRSSNTKNIRGTGLGLYIVNTYLQRMKGDMKIKSKLNEGTEITCTFPVIISN